MIPSVSHQSRAHRRPVVSVAPARELMLAALYWRLAQTPTHAERLERAIAHLEPSARESHAAVVAAARASLDRPRSQAARRRLAAAMDDVWRRGDTRRRRYWWEEDDV